MTDTLEKLLEDIGGKENVRWIGVETKTSIDPNFAGNTGWLRFIGEGKDDKDPSTANLIATDKLPKRAARDLMCGEWIVGDATVSAKLRSNGVELRMISEADATSKDAIPALRHDIETLTRAVPGNAGKYMRIAVYTGFRTKEDFDEGRLTTIAERFIGFSNVSLFGGAE
jgi:hypothetical protein